MTKLFQQGYALLIAVDESQETNLALPAVAKDLNALKAVLIHEERCAYPPDHVKVLTGSDATLAGIRAGLDWLQDQIDNDTTGNLTAIVYYSGHGCRDKQTGAYYLLPYDVNQKRLATSALSATAFSETVKALTPKRLLVILDCCHAAGMDVKGDEPTAAPSPAAFANDRYEASPIPITAWLGPDAIVDAPIDGAKGLEQLQTGAGRAILSSCQASEKSYIRQDRTMSIFTYHLIAALTGHAQPQDGATEVLVSDLLGYLYRTVPKSARTEQGKEQTPSSSATDNFPIALLLGGKGLDKGGDAPDPLAPLPQTTPTQQATNSGSGAIAQGSGAVAAGEQGIAVGGNVTGSTFITGDGNTVRRVNTGGGTYIEGNVDTKGGDFVGRDKHVVRRTTFDQRDQIVLGGQTNIDGGVNTGGGIVNSSIINTGTAPAQPSLVAQLRNLQSAIAQAGQQGLLDEDTAIDVDGALRKAINQAEKATPDRQAIQSHLATAGNKLALIPAVGGLVTAVNAISRLLR